MCDTSVSEFKNYTSDVQAVRLANLFRNTFCRLLFKFCSIPPDLRFYPVHITYLEVVQIALEIILSASLR